MHKAFLIAAGVFGLVAKTAAANETPFIGAVNFSSCVTESKTGKKEQEGVESIRKQMAAMIEDTEKELKELSAKFEDTEYLDSLSPKAEEELKARFQTLQENLNGYQNQFYQVMQHASYAMAQKIGSNIAKAAEKIAKERKLDYVINKEACFYIRPDLDMTTEVIKEMDTYFDLDSLKNKKLSDNTTELNAAAETTTEKAG